MSMDYQISPLKNIQNFSEESSLKNWRQMFYVLRNMPSGGTLFTLVFTGEVYAVSPVTPAAQTRISRKRCIVILHVQNIAFIEFSFTKTSIFTLTRLLSWNHSTARNPYTAASEKNWKYHDDTKNIWKITFAMLWKKEKRFEMQMDQSNLVHLIEHSSHKYTQKIRGCGWSRKRLFERTFSESRAHTR